MEQPSEDKRIPSIDVNLCTGCGLCVFLCPSRILDLRDGKAAVIGSSCMGCGHCLAVCPEAAVGTGSLDMEPWGFETVDWSGKHVRPGEYPLGELASLLSSRRSCRSFREEPVEEAVLRDLVTAGTMAPSGTNSQAWTFTLLPDRAGVARLGELVGNYFRKLNRQAENPLLRNMLRLLGKSELDGYWRGYYSTVREALRLWDEENRDLLFHGASAAILVGSRPEASCGPEDALLAAQNILLAAHCLGLGTCLIGFAVSAMQRDSDIQKSLSIPPEERIHAAIALGRPKVRFQRVTGRRAPFIRTIGP